MGIEVLHGPDLLGYLFDFVILVRSGNGEWGTRTPKLIPASLFAICLLLLHLSRF